jgi:hypothetical protein
LQDLFAQQQHAAKQQGDDGEEFNPDVLRACAAGVAKKLLANRTKMLGRLRVQKHREKQQAVATPQKGRQHQPQQQQQQQQCKEEDGQQQ